MQDFGCRNIIPRDSTDRTGKFREVARLFGKSPLLVDRCDSRDHESSVSTFSSNQHRLVRHFPQDPYASRPPALFKLAKLQRSLLKCDSELSDTSLGNVCRILG